jgi:hypothetical protein
MRGTFFNAGSSLSIGVFFSLMIAGLAAKLPSTLTGGLQAHGVSSPAADAAGQLPPVASLFASFLGFNPIATILDQIDKLGVPVGIRLDDSDADYAKLTDQHFFPQLMSEPFHHGLVVVFASAAAMCVLAAAASWLAGGKYVHVDEPALAEAAEA